MTKKINAHQIIENEIAELKITRSSFLNKGNFKYADSLSARIYNLELSIISKKKSN